MGVSLQSERTEKGTVLRKLALFASAGAVLVLATFAHSQQIDFAVGASGLLSSKDTTASQAYLPAAEKGGTYASFSGDVIFKNHFGFSAELATRAKYGLYNNYQQYRPILYDINGVFAPRVGERTSVHLMAGVGGQSVLFYNKYYLCTYPSGCTAHVNSTQLLAHAGASIHYSVWRNFFVGPEAHFYHIVNNTAFHSDNVFRLGASVGYTFGSE